MSCIFLFHVEIEHFGVRSRQNEIGEWLWMPHHAVLGSGIDRQEPDEKPDEEKALQRAHFELTIEALPRN